MGGLPAPWDASTALGEAEYTGERGIRLVSKTCFECHAGTADGNTIRTAAVYGGDAPTYRPLTQPG